MKDKKQIEKIANVIDGLENAYDTYWKSNCEQLAVELYNAGCRMQSEGEWITLEPSIGLFTCSLCDHRILRAKCNYCPNCGAKMK